MAVEVLHGIWSLEHTRGGNVYVTRAADGSYVIVDSAFRGSANSVARMATFNQMLWRPDYPPRRSRPRP